MGEFVVTYLIGLDSRLALGYLVIILIIFVQFDEIFDFHL